MYWKKTKKFAKLKFDPTWFFSNLAKSKFDPTWFFSSFFQDLKRM
jgi:hypothetical protein